MDLGNWFEDESVTVDSTSLKDFEQMIEQYMGVREEKEALEDQVKAKNDIIRKMEAKLRSHFEAQGITSYKTRMGQLIMSERVTFKAPEGEERENVMQALRDSGQIENVLGFNAQKFSSWYKSELEANKEFSLPGVIEDHMVLMSFRKAK